MIVSINTAKSQNISGIQVARWTRGRIKGNETAEVPGKLLDWEWRIICRC